MEKDDSKPGTASLLIGIFNPIALTIVFSSRNWTLIGIMLFGIPAVGILLGLAGLLGKNKKRAPAIAGIVLNLLPYALVAIGIYALKNSSGNFGTFR